MTKDIIIKQFRPIPASKIMIVLKRSIQAIAAELGLQISNINAYAHAETQRIGSTGASEVFTHYIRNLNEFTGDEELIRFMNFYADHWRLSSSQWSQDIFAMYATNMKQKGAYLEIGGADGYTHSNTYSLEKNFHWRGLLIEPDEEQFKRLKRIRPENDLLNAAISPNGKNEFLRLRRLGQLSAVEGLEGKDMHRETRLKSKSFATVKALSLTPLLTETAYDYFSLDVEGAEFRILNSIDWDRVTKPFCLTIEYNSRIEDRVALIDLLNRYGYVERFQNYSWLRRNDIWMTLGKL